MELWRTLKKQEKSKEEEEEEEALCFRMVGEGSAPPKQRTIFLRHQESWVSLFQLGL